MEMTVDKKKGARVGHNGENPQNWGKESTKTGQNEGHQYRESHESRTGRNISQRLKETRRELKIRGRQKERKKETE